MKPTTEPQSTDDPRLLEIAQEYLEELEMGRSPDRQEYITRAGALGPSIRVYLEALDALHRPASLGSGRSSARPPLEGSLNLREPLGDFHIVREIGRGGMGVVYEAVQRSLGRRVALKVLPFAAGLDAKQLQRFKNEAQAAAQLHHPNIVPVHAVGVERGVHFYAMQLINGQNLASLLQALRGEATPNSKRLSPQSQDDLTGSFHPGEHQESVAAGPPPTTVMANISTSFSEKVGDYFRQITGLMLQAAEALEYAHSVGVVHRDIKPANLLLDVYGKVWVADFGLAQFQANGNLTQTGDLLGTLRYMSPEQAGGQRHLIDHRVDVYSLGATFYEFLTLTPIFDGDNRQTLLHQILNVEPRAPRGINSAIPVELETIVLKAVSKVPSERYPTGHELAADLQRFLNDEPIQARRPSLWEKVAKWSRRHRGVVVATVVALLVCLVGLSVATALTVRAYERERTKAAEAKQQKQRAERERRKAEREKAKAEKSFRQARAAVARIIQISEVELAGKPFVERTRRRLLEVALEYNQSFLELHGDDPTRQAELEASRNKVETILAELTTIMDAGQYYLLTFEPVAKELKLAEGQKRDIAKIHQLWKEVLFNYRDRVSPKVRERKLLNAAREQEASVAKLLTTKQMKRFKEIALQAKGATALTDPEVVAALKLKPKQLTAIHTILNELSVGPPWERHGPAGQTDNAKMQKILEVLSDRQKRQWEQLRGKPFQFRDDDRGGRRGPRGRPPSRGWGSKRGNGRRR